MKFVFLLAFYVSGPLLISGLISGCANHSQPKVQNDFEATLATIEWLESHIGYITEPEVNRLMQRVANRLSSTVIDPSIPLGSSSKPDSPYHLPQAPWQVYILRSKDPIAFSSGSGVIFISSGLIILLQSEAELASVIAHEMAHGLLGHTATETQSTKTQSTKTQSTKTQSTKTQSEEATIEHEPYRHDPQVHFSLNQELAADNLSFYLLYHARYDVRASISALMNSALPSIYRPPGKFVSTANTREFPEWLQIRVAQLHSKLSQQKHFLPATNLTRDFTKVQRLLSKD